VLFGNIALCGLHSDFTLRWGYKSAQCWKPSDSQWNGWKSSTSYRRQNRRFEFINAFSKSCKLPKDIFSKLPRFACIEMQFCKPISI